jgi:anti-anti-sigma regulatory factor
VTLRIDTTSEGSKTIVSVAGRLEGSGVHELLRTRQSIEGGFVLDLTGLRSADPSGIEAIRKLVRRGAELREVSPFIRLLLDDQPAAD